MGRFFQRTWRRTSQYICDANNLPPGFRIVLLNEDGRAMRDDLEVRSGDFGVFPRTFLVSQFLDQALTINIKHPEDIGFASVQLRDHRNTPIDDDMVLRDVRDMVGSRGEHSDAYWQKAEIVDQLADDLAEELMSHFDGWDAPYDSNDDILPRAFLQLMFDKFEFEDIEYLYPIYLEKGRRGR